MSKQKAKEGKVHWLIRNVDPKVKEDLSTMAKKHGMTQPELLGSLVTLYRKWSVLSKDFDPVKEFDTQPHVSRALEN